MMSVVRWPSLPYAISIEDDRDLLQGKATGLRVKEVNTEDREYEPSVKILVRWAKTRIKGTHSHEVIDNVVLPSQCLEGYGVHVSDKRKSSDSVPCQPPR